MSTIGGQYLTLADWAKRRDPEGKIPVIVDLLSQTNEIVDDMLWVEGNLPDGHQTTVRTGLPSGTWRMLYQGVQPGKSTTAQITERVGNLEAYSEIDKDLVELNGNSSQFRLSESAAFLEGITQQFASAVMYSNSIATPAQFMGFAPRYSTVTTTNAQTAYNVIDAGGTQSTNTSIWFVGWGPNKVSGIFPRGSTMGLMHKDLGLWVKEKSDGSLLQVYRDHYQWKCGMVVQDWRYVVRIANIDVATLNDTTAPNFATLLTKAANLFPTAPAGLSAVQRATAASSDLSPPSFAIYCNRTVRTALEVQLLNKPGSNNTFIFLNKDEWAGKTVLSYRGVPIRTVDAILNTETRVT